jgi:hypothetical protein
MLHLHHTRIEIAIFAAVSVLPSPLWSTGPKVEVLRANAGDRRDRFRRSTMAPNRRHLITAELIRKGYRDVARRNHRRDDLRPLRNRAIAEHDDR